MTPSPLHLSLRGPLALLMAALLTQLPSSAGALELGAGAGAGAAAARLGTGQGAWGAGAHFILSAPFGERSGAELGALGAYLAGAQGGDPESVVALSAAYRFRFDAFRYVPYASLGPVLYLRAPRPAGDEPATGLGALLALGVQWRFAREASLGARLELHGAASALSDFALFSFAGIQYTRHIRW